MNISGFGISSVEYSTGYAKKKETAKDRVLYSAPRKEVEEEKSKEQDTLPEREESGGSQTQIIVKPDGTRILMVTTRVCGMEATMSLKLSDQESMLHTPKMEEPAAMEADIPMTGNGAAVP